MRILRFLGSLDDDLEILGSGLQVYRFAGLAEDPQALGEDPGAWGEDLEDPGEDPEDLGL